MVQESIKKEFDLIFQFGVIPEQWKHTILVMIPKVDKPKKITEFRPIALCNVIYKIFAKLLVNRLRGILNKIISVEQNAFIPGRYLHDSILTLNEVVNTVNRSKSKYPIVILKLDLEKAYDRVDWSIVLKILEKMGMLIKIRKWIEACLMGVSYSCKVNGVSSRSFGSNKGIRQGDSLSPYLFIIMEQLLTTLVNYAVNKKDIDVFKIGNTVISHSLFADDMVFFIKGNKKSCKNLVAVLEKYCLATGQKVNMEKSTILFPENCKTEVKQRICKDLNIKEGCYPLLYLGTYISPKRLEKKFQMKLVHKAKGKMESWSGNQLTQAGKCVMLNAMVNSLPMHSLMTSWVSESAIKEIVKLEKT
ncbi:hypothetical protein Cni_G13302 [Canna indica]|uniref:Reverse transcriptase domain-containing protein n=1 Tax=Canna indica TaxID=4628 RepID=A0AAQ3Q9R0_9LILI|nr:hypothetical protein Cni_G13302 [Canna indica]